MPGSDPLQPPLFLSPGTCCSSWAIMPSLTGGCHLQTLRSCHDLLKKLWLCLSQGLLPWYQVVLVALPSPISKQRGTPSRRGRAVRRYPAASFSCTDSAGWHYKGHCLHLSVYRQGHTPQKLGRFSSHLATSQTSTIEGGLCSNKFS